MGSAGGPGEEAVWLLLLPPGLSCCPDPQRMSLGGPTTARNPAGSAPVFLPRRTHENEIEKLTRISENGSGEKLKRLGKRAPPHECWGAWAAAEPLLAQRSCLSPAFLSPGLFQGHLGACNSVGPCLKHHLVPLEFRHVAPRTRAPIPPHSVSSRPACRQGGLGRMQQSPDACSCAAGALVCLWFGLVVSEA